MKLVLISLCLIILSGCVTVTKTIRITEYGGSGQYTPFADLKIGGCLVEGSQEELKNVKITYKGNNCVVNYMVDEVESGTTVEKP